MNKTLLALVVGVLLGLYALHSSASAPDLPGANTEGEYPYVGMSVEELRQAFGKIAPLLPGDNRNNILRIDIRDPEHLELRTGRVNGPLSGYGKAFRFKKAGKKWEKAGEMSWTS